jgi:hypothetical protein
LRPVPTHLQAEDHSMNTLTTQAEFRSLADTGARYTLPPGPLLGSLFFGFFLLANIYDMGGTHGLKYISYVLLVLMIPCARRPLNLRMHEELGIAWLFLVWPACALLIGLANGADLSGVEGAISQATPFLGFFVPLLVVPILGAQRVLVFMYLAFLTMAIAMVILTPLMYQGVAMGFITRIPEFCSAIYAPYHGGIGEYRLYFQATLWMVPAGVYFAKSARFPLAMLCLAGLIMSGSKAGALIAFAFILWILLKSKSHRVLGLVCIVAASAAGLYFLPSFLAIMRDAFLVSDSNGLLIRYGHAYSVIQVFLQKPWTIFIGNGAGATFYSSGTGEWEVRMETDHLDAIFRYGIVWFTGFTSLCFWVIRRLLRSGHVNHRAHGLGLLSMYLASGTNPQLISPLFMFYLCACYLIARQLPKRRSSGPTQGRTRGWVDSPQKSEAAARLLPSDGPSWEG